MAESPAISTPTPPPTPDNAKEKTWHSYISNDLPRTVQQSTNSAIRSARSFQQSSSTHIRAIQEFLPQLRTQFKTYEHTFFQNVKEELISAKEHPAAASGVALTIALLLMRGPRRFLFRHTLGRFQSEEAHFVRVENNMRELNLSVDLMKKESRKLVERAALAEKDMRQGQSDLAKAGGEIQSLAKSVYKAEAEATGLMDLLREIPGREALKLRAEIGCALIGSLGALYNGVLLINLAVALFALVAIESSSQILGRTYAVLLFCCILLDIPWFILFACEIWHISSEVYGTFVVFSVKLTLCMQIIGFFLRLSSSLLWIQMYRLGVSHLDASAPREADADLRNSFLSPATPSIVRHPSGSDDVLGGSIYNPAYYSSLFEDGKDDAHMHCGHGDAVQSIPTAETSELKLGLDRTVESEGVVRQLHTVNI